MDSAVKEKYYLLRPLVLCGECGQRGRGTDLRVLCEELQADLEAGAWERQGIPGAGLDERWGGESGWC